MARPAPGGGSHEAGSLGVKRPSGIITIVKGSPLLGEATTKDSDRPEDSGMRPRKHSSRG